ncbi:hypothetical protein DES39_1873 [Orbus hercynius]|uniref:Pyridoxamine 5'-phosphate oxidase putative domain-containing protein n=1 Tax=Orbus hercynius TaxID=593135 RepID=A0A495RB02_9GAMM|nr:hypothetical protein [Orbus hercynius]RKS84662.1 hypothetical protein DES39_1873 [Orbus hercynius]
MGKDHDDLNKIITYLTKKTTLTLCCVDKEVPYCCNCFYVLNKAKMMLYITSSFNTHHANIMLKSQQVAGTINDQARSVAYIQGVQYTGQITLLNNEDEQQARNLFCQAYPIAKLKEAPMWAITLSMLKMTDNKLGFGKKFLWHRADCET